MPLVCRRIHRLRYCSVLWFLIVAGAVFAYSVAGQIDDSVECYAVLLEVHEYPEPYTDIPLGHVDVERISDMLELLGWPTESITVYLDNEVTRGKLIQSLNWLSRNTDGSDLVFFYLTAHGTFVRDVLRWNATVPSRWARIASPHKVLLLSSCVAGMFIAPFAEIETSGQIVVGAVGPREYNWCGVEEEGLPIVGRPIVHYFVQAMADSKSDADGDVSVEKAIETSTPRFQEYFREEIFVAPEFLEQFRVAHANDGWPFCPDRYPNPVVVDTDPSPMILDTSYY